MKAFPFSLDGAAKDWLYLQLALFNTWGDMKRTFLEKFFPASRTASIRKEICWIRISRDVLRTIIRRLSRDEVVSAKTDSISAKPDQARLHGPSAQLSSSGPPQLQLNFHVTPGVAYYARYTR
ncbi:hypothetical protein CR513_48206, partial [Mucuna pruriens]